MRRFYWVYIVASQRNGTLYIGVTNDLARRIHEHKTKALPGFTSRYNVCNLVWYEEHADTLGAQMEVEADRGREPGMA